MKNLDFVSQSMFYKYGGVLLLGSWFVYYTT